MLVDNNDGIINSLLYDSTPKKIRDGGDFETPNQNILFSIPHEQDSTEQLGKCGSFM